MNQLPQYLSLSTLFITGRACDHVVAFNADKKIDWSQFSADVTSLGKRIRAHSAQNIALCSSDSYLFAVGFFAVGYSQKSLILPSNYQPAALLELSNAFDLLLCDQEIASSVSLKHLLIESSVSPFVSDDVTFNIKTIDLTLFTSGSSGTPKAVRKTLQQLEIEINTLQQWVGHNFQSCRFESTVSHQHIYGLLFRLLWPLCAGHPFARFNLEFPEQLVTHAGEDVILISSPALLKRLTAQYQCVPFAAVFSSGGPLSYESAHHAYQLFGQWPMEVFGSTETGGIAYRQQCYPAQPWSVFPGITIQINDDHCLCLRSPHIDPHHWYQTADQCELLNDRQFILKERTDRVIKLEEKRISLVEVEKRLDQLPWITESAVVPIQEENRLILAAALVLSQDGMQLAAQIGKGKFWLHLRHELRQWLEPISIPRRFRVVTHIPLNSQGKRLNNEIAQCFQTSTLSVN
ncbi:MAG: AMP-binding protein [Vibrio sp.]